MFQLLLSLFKYFKLLISGQIINHKKSKNLRLYVNSYEYIIFRHISIFKKTKNSSILVLRFKFPHSSLKKDKIESFFQIPFFVGLCGFEEKLWTFDEKNGVFQGIYQWENEEYINQYLNSAAVNFVKNKAIKNSVHYDIILNTTMDEFIKKHININ